MQADIAFILGFSLTELNEFTLREISYWHELAIARYEAANKVE